MSARRTARVGARFAALVTLVLLGAGAAAGAAVAAEPVPPSGSPDIPITVTIPDLTPAPDAPFTVSDASLRWALNAESGSGAFFGGCNFLMAGRPGTDGNTHGGTVWSDATYYHASAGDVRVVTPDASGVYRAASFATRCQAPDGRTVTTGNGLATGTQVVVDGGTGTVDPRRGTATIRWKGTFTSVFYGGLTYWWASDPVLTVKADGTGTLTATAGGYGTSMDDLSTWVPLPATKVVLADLARVPVGAGKGFKVTPRYVGVSVKTPAGQTAQAPRTAENAATWGSFPQSFVDFQARTGQLSYWFTSGGQRDPFKVAAPVYVSYDADAPVSVDPGDTTGSTGSTGGGSEPSNPVVEPPATTTAPPAAPSGSGLPGGPGGPGGPGASGAGALAPLPGPTLVPDAAPAALAATTGRTVGASRPLVPTISQPPPHGDDLLTYASAGLLVGVAGAAYGFRKGWLVLPFLR